MEFLTPMPVSFRQYRAAKYKLSGGYICPDSQDVEVQDFDNDELLEDYMNLISAYATEAPLVLECSPYLPEARREREFYRQLDAMADRLLKFCSRWGLFGLFTDQAYFVNTERAGGIMFHSSSPVKAIVYRNDYDFEGGDAHEVEFAEYAREYHLCPPYKNRADAERDYSEPVMGILTDERIKATANHIRNILSGSISQMPIKRPTLVLNSDGAARPAAQSLNEYCQVLFMLDQMRGPSRTYEVCRHCGTAFLTKPTPGARPRIFCSDSCMNSERNRRHRQRKKLEGGKDAE